MDGLMKFKSESTGLELEVGEPTRAQQRTLGRAMRVMYLGMSEKNLERVFGLVMDISGIAEQLPDDLPVGDEQNIVDELSGIYTEAMHSKKKQD